MAGKAPILNQAANDFPSRGIGRILDVIAVAVPILIVLGGAFYKFVDHENRISKLEVRYDTVLQQLDAQGVHTTKSISMLDIDASMPSGEKLIRLHLPFSIRWSNQSNMVVQVYNKDGNLVFPKNNPNEEHSSGFVLPIFPPGTYEIKLWIPGNKEPYKIVLIQVVE